MIIKRYGQQLVDADIRESNPSVKYTPEMLAAERNRLVETDLRNAIAEHRGIKPEQVDPAVLQRMLAEHLEAQKELGVAGPHPLIPASKRVAANLGLNYAQRQAGNMAGRMVNRATPALVSRSFGSAGPLLSKAVGGPAGQLGLSIVQDLADRSGALHKVPWLGEFLGADPTGGLNTHIHANAINAQREASQDVLAPGNFGKTMKDIVSPAAWNASRDMHAQRLGYRDRAHMAQSPFNLDHLIRFNAGNLVANPATKPIMAAVSPVLGVASRPVTSAEGVWERRDQLGRDKTKSLGQDLADSSMILRGIKNLGEYHPIDSLSETVNPYIDKLDRMMPWRRYSPE